MKKSKIREIIENWRKCSQTGCCEWDFDDLEEDMQEYIDSLTTVTLEALPSTDSYTKADDEER